MTKGYWQIPVRPEDREKTAFVCEEGLFEFVKMPFGLVNAGATFSRLMRKVLKNLDNVINYIDDILIFSETWEEHIETLIKVLERLRNANLSIRPSKCLFGFDTVPFLGHNVGNCQINPQEDKINKIKMFPKPEIKKALRSFLGLCNYYRDFIPNYAELAAPLTEATGSRQNNKLVWSKIMEESFENLKVMLTDKPILTLPDVNKSFYLQCDASDIGMGCVLLQKYGERLHPVGYASKKLLPREQKYASMERECLSIVWGINHFGRYLYGNNFTLFTDHKPLTYLHTAKFVNNRVLRWSLMLQPYKFTVESITGKANVIADFLSRYPLVDEC